MLRLMLMLCTALLSVSCVNAQEVTHTKITDSIYMLKGKGGNIGLSIGVDGILIVDTQFADMEPKIRKAISDLQSGDIDYIINTHFHGDHTGGNSALGQDTPIIAHENVRNRMKEGKDLSDKTFRNSLPSITYEDKVNVHFNGEDIQLAHYKTGHTDTDTVVYFPNANVLHTGDLFFNGFFPFVDIESGGNVDDYMENVQSLIDNAPKDVTIIPGHGPLATMEDYKTFLSVMQETIAIIREGMAAGKSKEELQKKGLPDRYASAGAGFISTKRWISIVYDSYSE